MLYPLTLNPCPSILFPHWLPPNYLPLPPPLFPFSLTHIHRSTHEQLAYGEWKVTTTFFHHFHQLISALILQQIGVTFDAFKLNNKCVQ